MKQSKFFFLLAAWTGLSLSVWAAGTSIDGIHYLLDAGSRTAKVTYTGLNEATPSTYSGDVVIPDTVVYAQTAYAVTAVGKSAFLSCTGLRSVVLPATITAIEQQGFFHCTALDTLIINAVNPPSVGNFVFNNCPATMVVGVPCGCLPVYSTASGWSPFAASMIETCPPDAQMTFLADSDMGSVYPTDTLVRIGDTIRVVATPRPYYQFTGWSNGQTSDTLRIVASGDTTLTAYFAPRVCYVSAVSNDSRMGHVLGGGSCAYGDSLLLIAIVNDTDRFVFQQWSNGRMEDSIWIKPTESTTITAQFALRTYALNVVPNDSTWGVTEGSGVYEYGTVVTIYAVPNARFEFLGWANGDPRQVTQITVTCDSTVQAVFDHIKYKVTAVADDPIKGITSGDGKCIYGDSILVRAQVRDTVKYIFKGWANGQTADSLWVKPQADTVVTALFAMRPYEVKVVANNADWGVVSGSGIYDYGTAVLLSAVPNEHYDWVAWDNSRKDSVMRFHLTGDTTIMAQFTPHRYKVFGASMDQHMGYVAPGYAEVSYGESVTLYAHPTDSARFWFEKWSTGVTVPSLVVTPSSDTTLMTYWRPIHTVSFSSIIGEPVSEQKIVNGFLATEPQTPQQEPYKFMGWYTTEECKTLFDFNGPVVHDTTLYASWVIYTEMWDTAVCSYEWLDVQQGDTLIFDSGDYARRYATPTLDSIHTKHLVVYTPSTDNDLANLAPEITPMYQRWNIVLDVNSFTAILEGLGGQMVGPDMVHWYKVVGEPDMLDNAGIPSGDDVQAVPFTGYYHTEGAAMSGDYYAVIRIEHFEGQTCSATFRTNIVTMDPAHAIQRIGEGCVGYDVLGRKVDENYRGYVVYDDGTKTIKW